MRIVTAAEMRAAEVEATRRGVPEPELMAIAGAAVARFAHDREPEGPVVVLVGTGNNGGDALVAAAHLLEAGRPVAIWTAPGRRTLSPVPEARLGDAQRLDTLMALESALLQAAVVLDGLYGIGLSRQVEGPVAAAIASVNATARAADATVIAIDVPSGVLADSGKIAGGAIMATMTVALGFPKPGLYIGAGARHAGRIQVVDIGLPEGIDVPEGPRTITTTQVAELLPSRAPTADKRDVGSVLVVGGALNYPGAPRLAGLGAMRVGAGYVTLAVPRSIYGIVAGTLLEATYLPLPEMDGQLGESAAEALGEEIGRYSALVLGCGLGREPGTGAFLERLLGVGGRRRGVIGFGVAAPPTDGVQPILPADLPVVLDADALNLLSEIENWSGRLNQPAVLTPNIREMARLTGKEAEEIEAEPWRVTSEAARQWGQVVVLKKGHSLVATPEGDVWVSEQATPALATAGSGDVLSGAIGGLLAQGLAPWQAAVVALHLGMLAAEKGTELVGVHGLIATDIPRLLAETMRDLARHTSKTGST